MHINVGPVCVLAGTMPRGSGTRPLFLYNGSLTSLMPSGRTADATLDSHAVAVAQTAHETNAGACCEQNVALGRCVRQCTLPSSRPSRATTPSLPKKIGRRLAPFCIPCIAMSTHTTPHTQICRRIRCRTQPRLECRWCRSRDRRVAVHGCAQGRRRRCCVPHSAAHGRPSAGGGRGTVAAARRNEGDSDSRFWPLSALSSVSVSAPLCSLNAFTSLSSHPLHLLSSLAVLFSLSPLHFLHSQHSTSFFICPKSRMFTNAPQRAHMQQSFAHSSDARAPPFPPHR